MTPSARVQAAITLLDEILEGKPAEQALTGWARRSRFAGSKDRAAVRDHVFDVLRRRRSCAAWGGAETGRELMLGALRQDGADLDTLFDGSTYGPAQVAPAETGQAPAPGAEASDFPDWLWPEFTRSLGQDALTGAAYLRQRAPVFLRANTACITSEALIDRLAEQKIVVHPHSAADTALEVTQGARQLRQSEAFAEGLFELQDAASQAVVAALPLTAGQRVLDYCAGGGGKTLAIGAGAQVTLFAHDGDPGRMRDLPARARRAGLSVRITPQTDLRRQGPFDLVLCDVPCSGSGSWRRAPDGKWTLTPDRLAGLTRTQDAILDQASTLVAPGGHLAYVTCSVLKVENEDRVRAFGDRHPEWHSISSRRWPLAGGGDGFYLSLLTRKDVAVHPKGE